jgi:hypothetical protein
MPVSCVLALKEDSLIRLTLINIISASEQGLTLIDSRAEDLAGLVGEIRRYGKDTILLVTSSAFSGEDALIELLLFNPKLSVIVINEDSNWLHIFRRNDRWLTSPTDLLDAIQSV